MLESEIDKEISGCINSAEVDLAAFVQYRNLVKDLDCYCYGDNCLIVGLTS